MTREIQTKTMRSHLTQQNRCYQKDKIGKISSKNVGKRELWDIIGKNVWGVLKMVNKFKILQKNL